MKIRILLLLISFNLFSQDIECPGYVFDKQLEEYKFTGQCSEGDLPVWGVANYDNGASFQGYFNSEGLFDIGILTLTSGAYMIGEFNTPGELLGSKYSAVGRFVFSDGGYAESYFDESLLAVGFGAIFYDDGYHMGMLSNDMLNGIGVKRNDKLGSNHYSTWVNSKANGIVFSEYDDGQSAQNQYINDEAIVGDSLPIQGLAKNQLDEIKKFLNLNYAELMAKIADIEAAMDEFIVLVDQADAQIEATTTQSKFASKRSLIVKSAQELLAVLGYKLGKADGILGPLTIAAIEAFKQDQGLVKDLEVDENLLVELQKQVRKESNSENNSSVPTEPSISGTGTGFFVNNEILVTNEHVIDGCVYLTDSQNNNLEIVTVDRLNDLAVLRSSVASKDYIYLDDDPELGELVYVAGFPYNFDTLNFTSGAVSALVGFEKNITQFQFTAPIQPGNSGGPILNTWGSLIGVTFARIDDLAILEATNTLPQNINYGIKLDVIRDILTEYDISFDQGRAYWLKPSQEDVAQLAKDSTILINCFK
tara:strand:+ start:242 stop:1846 length:1605 start_codon:yes stop_codon:yes gene_type:complete